MSDVSLEDIARLRPGDRVLAELTVVRVQVGDALPTVNRNEPWPVVVRITPKFAVFDKEPSLRLIDNGSVYVSHKCIRKLLPAPRDIKVGSKVILKGRPGVYYDVLALDGDMVVWRSSLHAYGGTPKSDMEVVP